MFKKTFNKLKLNIILTGVFVFFIATVNVFAACTSYNTGCKSKTDGDYTCETYTVDYAHGIKGCKISGCVNTGYTLSNGKCVKVSGKTATISGYYVCGSSCKYYVKGDTLASSCNVTGYGIEANCKSAISSSKKATISGYYNCGGSCKYYVKGDALASSCNVTGYGTEANCKSAIAGNPTGPFCSNSNSSGKTQAQKDAGKSTVSKSECNNLYSASRGDYYKSEWYSTCCYISVRNTATKSNSTTTGNSGSTTTTTVSKYDISFNVMGGYSNTFPCPTNTSATSPGVCYGYVASGTTVNYPSSANSTELSKSGEGAFIGWTKVLQADGTPDCRKSYIDKTNTSVKVTSKTNLYACYKEIIGDNRYVQDGYVADGGSVDWPCGQAMWIEYCTIENGTDYCYYYENSTNSYRKVYRNKLAETEAGAACGNETTDATTAEDKGYRYATIDGDKFSCGDQLYVTTCTDDACSFTKIKTSSKEFTEDGTIDRNKLAETESAAACKQEETKCTNQEMPGMRKASNYAICYDKKYKNDEEEKKSLLAKYYKCDTDAGYYFDTTAVVAVNTPDCGDDTCKQTYKVSCTLGKKAKPTLSVMPAISSGGYGDIKVTAKAVKGEIVEYYYSPDYTTPTSSSPGWKKTNSDSFTINSTPGVIYIWVKDSNGVISNAVSGAVIDTTNSNTTINKLEVYDANGNIQNPTSTGTAYNVADVKDSKYVRLSNDLSKESNVVADAFNPYDMEYKLEVSSPTITVYATLTSNDSNYVDGYEPRTVNLKYGINTVLIKIQNKEGITRTYTILVTRTDDRTSDNTLSDINLSVGNINFNANVTDYKIEVPKNTESVEVNATIGSDKASYVEGYEPGKVAIIGDTTVNLIKVKSETGSTRTYVLTFIKEGTDIISKESLQLSDLVIPDVYVPFERDVSNYSISVDYETDIISLETVLMDENSIIGIDVKRKNDTEYRAVSGKGIGLDVGENFIEIKVIDSDNVESYYRLTIIRKEFGLDISNDTSLKDLKVLGYDIDFEPGKKDYTVKIKQEKSLVITAVPTSNRAEVFIRGNDELTGFSTVRVKVVAENGEFETYSIDIKKDAFNKTIEIASIVAGVVIILVSSGIIIIKKKARANREYFEE